MRSAWVFTGTLLLALGCLPPLDGAERVHDLRMLAIRAEPPEQVVPLSILPDGGVAPAPGGLPTLSPVTITGLIADPAGGGRAIASSLVTCLQTEDDGRCHPESKGYQELGAVSVQPTDLGAEPAFTFTPSLQTLLGLVQADPFRGFGGVWLTVQLTIEAGSEHVVGMKRVVFTPAVTAPYPAANTNPSLLKMQVHGVDWAVGQRVALTNPDGFTPVPDTSRVETYQRPLFTGGSITLKESWRYNFFATLGTFSRTQTGGTNNLTGGAAPVDTNWQAMDGDAKGPLTVFIVVRDGRGGEDWVVRTASTP